MIILFKNLKYNVIYEYEFYRSANATETARKIINVYGAVVAKDKSVRFCSGNSFWKFVLEISNFTASPVSEEAYPSQTTFQLAAGFTVSDKNSFDRFEPKRENKKA